MRALNFVFVVFLSFTTFLFTCCNDDREEVQMWIAAERVMAIEAVSSSERPFLQYKLKESDNWMILNEAIIGFKYEEGYEYVLLVKYSKVERPAEDQPRINYTLLNVISKISKI